MKAIVCLVIAAVGGLLSACSDTIISTPTGAKMVYPIGADEADRVLAESMVEAF